jgi:PDDEXK-like domain of unknown function (DUF3799)
VSDDAAKVCVKCGRRGTRAFTGPLRRLVCTHAGACERRAARRRGIFALDAKRYHADPCPEPSLSKSSAHLICSRSPKHAWLQHPRLNPDWEPVQRTHFDIGTAAHAILLEGDETIVEIVDADSWRTNAAQEERTRIRRAGRIPLLAKDAGSVGGMVASVREQLAGRDDDPPLLTDGKPEQTLLWRDQGVWCRARPDWLSDDRRAIDDLKTTSGSADPQQWARNRLWDIGADLQAALYCHGVRALAGIRPEFRLIVVETDPPHGLSVLTLAPSAMELAQRKLDYALATWRECLQSGDWPGYPREIAHVELPGWEESRWLERTWTEDQAA